MKNAGVLISLVCVMAAANFASADTIQGINIDFVTIGHAGNAGYATIHGAVGYNYRIGKYEVTNTQWNVFTSVAGVPTGNPSNAYDQSAQFTGAQQPTNNVSWYEAAQFCNYLTSGDKSKGAYQFSGSNAAPGDFLGIDRAASISTYGITYVIPTYDEWFKAAYFKPAGNGYSYWANGNVEPIAGVQTNWNKVIGSPWDVGTGTAEQNGTFDMMGNVWEWNESIFYSSNRGLCGGSYYDSNSRLMCLDTWGSNSPDFESLGSGFRVAEIPEPATLLLLGLGGLALRKRK